MRRKVLRPQVRHMPGLGHDASIACTLALSTQPSMATAAVRSKPAVAAIPALCLRRVQAIRAMLPHLRCLTRRSAHTRQLALDVAPHPTMNRPLSIPPGFYTLIALPPEEHPPMKHCQRLVSSQRQHSSVPDRSLACFKEPPINSELPRAMDGARAEPPRTRWMWRERSQAWPESATSERLQDGVVQTFLRYSKPAIIRIGSAARPPPTDDGCSIGQSASSSSARRMRTASCANARHPRHPGHPR